MTSNHSLRPLGMTQTGGHGVPAARSSVFTRSTAKVPRHSWPAGCRAGTRRSAGTARQTWTPGRWTGPERAPACARARRGRRRLSRVPPGRVRRLRVTWLRRKRQQLDHALVPGGGGSPRACPSVSAGTGTVGSEVGAGKKAQGKKRGGRLGAGAAGSAEGGWGAWAGGALGRHAAGRGAGGLGSLGSLGSRAGLLAQLRWSAGDRNMARTAMPPATTATTTAMVSEVCTKVAAARPPISAAATTSSAQPDGWSTWTGRLGRAELGRADRDGPTGDWADRDWPTGDWPTGGLADRDGDWGWADGGRAGLALPGARSGARPRLRPHWPTWGS